LRWICHGQHFKCQEHADEGDVHFPIRQVRASAHARARSKGKVLSSRSLGDVQEPLRTKLQWKLEVVSVKVGRPGILDERSLSQHGMSQSSNKFVCASIAIITHHEECSSSRDGRTLPHNIFDAYAW
jgi:hypothetical protein